MKVRKLDQGKGKKTKKFYAVFTDGGGQVHRVPLFESRKPSEEAGRKIDQLIDHHAAGDSLPPELSRWLEQVPPKMLNSLAKAGVVDSKRTAASKLLTDHLNDWKTALLNKGNVPRDVVQKVKRVEDAFGACGFRFWSDVNASALSDHLNDRRKSEERFGAQTFNFYLQACKQFGRWMVREGRSTQSPLTHLQGLNVKTDRRHDRRALTADELRYLLDTAASAVTRWDMTGRERAMLYRLAAETGLRQNELRSLTRSSLHLEGDSPTVTIQAGYAKNRRQDTLPLRTDTATALAEFVASKMPAAPLFAMPERTEVIRMFRADLAEAREKWIAEAAEGEPRNAREKSSFLAYTDAANRHADFHSLRHTFISNLVNGGVHPKTAQSLARHGTIGLTMDRYTHVYRGDLAKALDVLPALPLPEVQEVKATGTDGLTKKTSRDLAAFLSVLLSPNGELTCSSKLPDGVLAAKAMFDKIRVKSLDLTDFARESTVEGTPRRSGRAAECAGLENRQHRCRVAL